MTHSYLKHYIQLVEFLGVTLGPDHEVALHDFADKSGSIIAIANGHISGRSIGAPLSKNSLEAISKGVYRNQNYIVYNAALSPKGKMLRTCTFFIKDSYENLIGLLCINFDDSRYQSLIQNVLKLCHPDNYVEQKYFYNHETAPVEAIDNDIESFHSSMEDVVDDILEKIISQRGMPIERLLPEEKLEIVDLMHEKGIFILKGAVKYAAQSLKCSQASIYRYLKKSKEKDNSRKG
ncbi:helix-turn-helix transcriptional regulator [Natronincola ferrireducens]|uniref:Predicted transcriptional regulator YheO, contains PAS and DNA-binding HTH domains n=1 Tax=Natronincola ferrireducens TaxID=393762 RepID=A0A1G9J8D0_9FIRM|nr:PAS domain-containing protein [Natronincola ferrireducens]SDL33532.1 Predicted transcriptional regulator YheO, contains PAS and DNA-binding HTH domains [Natronincola ferrireducens]